MRRSTWLVVVGAVLAVGAGQAALAAEAAHENMQQSKMKTCNADAKGKTGAERKAFMKECLSHESEAAAKPAEHLNSQQEKMKACNADAKGKTGADRKAFMKDCLKSGSAEGAKAEAATATKH